MNKNAQVVNKILNQVQQFIKFIKITIFVNNTKFVKTNK